MTQELLLIIKIQGDISAASSRKSESVQNKLKLKVLGSLRNLKFRIKALINIEPNISMFREDQIKGSSRGNSEIGRAEFICKAFSTKSKSGVFASNRSRIHGDIEGFPSSVRVTTVARDPFWGKSGLNGGEGEEKAKSKEGFVH